MVLVNGIEERSEFVKNMLKECSAECSSECSAECSSECSSNNHFLSKYLKYHGIVTTNE